MRLHRIITIGQGDTASSGPVLTQTSAAGVNPLAWSSFYPGAIVFDGTDGTKVDMQWRVNGGTWNADTRQALTSDVLLTGGFAWPLYGGASFALNAFVEVQERMVPYIGNVAQSPTAWSNTISDTMATGVGATTTNLHMLGSDVRFVLYNNNLRTGAAAIRET